MDDLYTRDPRLPERPLEDGHHARFRHVPAKRHPAGESSLPSGLLHQALQSFVSPLGLEVGVEPLLVLACLGFEQCARAGVIAVIVHARVAATDVETFWGLVVGFKQLMGEADRATTFHALRMAGERYGKLMGRNAARAFALLAMAAMGNTAPGLAAQVPKLPGSMQAAVQAETQVGLRLAAVGQVKTVAVSAETVTIALAPGAVAMTARSDSWTTGRLSGHPTRPGANDKRPENIKAIERENESARTLADNGYHVEQNPPPKPNGTKPDYRINGAYYDCYAPNSPSARNIATNLKNQKVSRDQADRIVLNLDDTSVTLEVMKKQLADWPIPGLKHVIAIKGGVVSILVP